MDSLVLLFSLQLLATPILAQISNGEEPFLYDTSDGRDYWKAGGQISFAIPMQFYDDRFSSIFVSLLTLIILYTNSNQFSIHPRNFHSYKVK